MGTPAGPGPEPRPSGTTSTSGNIGLDEETMSWVLLLQLDPLLDARWIQAAQQRLWTHATGVAVAALSDDDSGSDGDIAVSDYTTMTVAPATMTLSPERDRTALWHSSGARAGGGGTRRPVAQQQGYGHQREISNREERLNEAREKRHS